MGRERVAWQNPNFRIIDGENTDLSEADPGESLKSPDYVREFADRFMDRIREEDAVQEQNTATIIVFDSRKPSSVSAESKGAQTKPARWNLRSIIKKFIK